MVIGVLTRYALLPFISDLKAEQMNVQHNLIQEHMLCKFQQCHKIAKVTKNIYCMKSEGVVNHSMVTRLFKKFC